MSKIKAELVAATEFAAKRGEDEQAGLKRLVLAVQELSDAEWDKLSGPAQDWFNSAGTAMNKKKDIPAFPDAEPEAPAEEETKTRRRRSSEDEEPAKTKAPAVGDTVKLVTGRDKTVEGELIEISEKDDLVVVKDSAGDEIEFTKSKLKSLEVVGGEEPADDEPKSRRRRAADEDEPSGPKDPAVGDTVEIINARDKVYVGNIIEMDAEVVVIKDAAGEELEFPRDRLKSIKVKVDNSSKPAEDEPKTRRRSGGEAPADEKPAPRTSKEDNGGVAVGTRMRELIVEDLDASLEDIEKALKAEKLAFKDNTLSLVYKEVHKIVALLKAAGKLKK